MCTPFQETSRDLDRLARQTDSAVAKKAYQTLGAAFGFGSTAFKLPHDVAMGTVDFVADPVTGITSLPTAIQHNGDAMISGAILIADGRAAEGTALLTEGAAGDMMIAGAVTGIVKGAPKVYASYVDGVNTVLKVATDRRPTTFNADPFDIMARTNPEFGGVRIGGRKASATERARILEAIEKNPNFSSAQKIADHLGLPVDLVDQILDETTVATPSDTISSTTKSRILEAAANHPEFDSPRQIADHLGLSVATVTDVLSDTLRDGVSLSATIDRVIEAAANHPEFETAQEIADHLGLHVDLVEDILNGTLIR